MTMQHINTPDAARAAASAIRAALPLISARARNNVRGLAEFMEGLGRIHSETITFTVTTEA